MRKLTLTAIVDGTGNWRAVWDVMNQASQATAFEGISEVDVSMVNVESEPKETYDEQTLYKVGTVLNEVGLTTEAITMAINTMQNRGILFRERS